MMSVVALVLFLVYFISLFSLVFGFSALLVLSLFIYLIWHFKKKKVVGSLRFIVTLLRFPISRRDIVDEFPNGATRVGDEY